MATVQSSGAVRVVTQASQPSVGLESDNPDTIHASSSNSPSGVTLITAPDAFAAPEASGACAGGAGGASGARDESGQRTGVVAPIVRDRKDSESKTRFNNQNSIFMATVTGDGQRYYVMIVHDTRIYYFESTDLALLEGGNKLDVIIDDLTNMLLHLLTTTKYRILNAFYLMFQLVDQLALVCLVSGTFVNSSLRFEETLLEYWLVFLVLLVEILYVLMEYNVKIWILNRISVFIGVFLFCAYAGAIAYHDLWQEYFVLVLYFVRMFAFVTEVSVDYSLDLEIAVDLRNMWMSEMWPIFVWDKVTQNEHRRLQLPVNVNFIGSVCVWVFSNTFQVNRDYFDDRDGGKINLTMCKSFDNNGVNEQWHAHRICLYVVLGLTVLVALPLILVALVLMALFATLKWIGQYCRCCCRHCKKSSERNTIWYELAHEHSF